MKRCLSIVIILFVSLLQASCFQILNYIQFNQDGSVNVIWRFAIPSSLANQSSEGEDQSFEEKMEEARKKILAEMPDFVEDLQVSGIDTPYDTGMMISFRVPDARKMPEFGALPGEDTLPSFPIYDPDTNTLRVLFEDEDKKKTESPEERGETKDPEESRKPGDESDSANSASSDETNTSGSHEDGSNTNEADEMGNQLASMILSSARYQILVSGKVPLRARSVGADEKEVQILKLGDNYLIDYPFISSLVEEKQDVELIIDLK